MKAKLKKINIAGTWTLTVSLDIHAESSADINAYLMEVNEGIKNLAKHEAAKDKHKLNLRKADVRVSSGI